MEKCSVFIADDNKQWVESLTDIINSQEEFEVIGSADEGSSILEGIGRLKPALIIMDLVLPYHDGMFVINAIKENFAYYKPIIVILSGLGTDMMLKLATAAQVHYFFQKPVDPDMLITNLNRIVKESREDVVGSDPEEVISAVAFKIGLPVHLRGTDYVRDSISECLKDEEKLHLITKVLYPLIAKKKKVSAGQVERGIRYVISIAQKRNSEYFQNLFGDDAEELTNSRFLTLLVAHVKSKLQNT